eukprot:1158567-Rhodomonas_salina.1
MPAAMDQTHLGGCCVTRRPCSRCFAAALRQNGVWRGTGAEGNSGTVSRCFPLLSTTAKKIRNGRETEKLKNRLGDDSARRSRDLSDTGT